MLATLALSLTLSLAPLEQPCEVDVAEGDAPATLMIMSAQCHIESLYLFEDLHGLSTAAVHGRFSLREILTQMTAPTSIIYRTSIDEDAQAFVSFKSAAPFLVDQVPHACVPSTWMAQFTFSKLDWIVVRVGAVEMAPLLCFPTTPLKRGGDA